MNIIQIIAAAIVGTWLFLGLFIIAACIGATRSDRRMNAAFAQWLAEHGWVEAHHG